MAGEAGVDEPGGGVGQQAEPAERGLALEASGQVALFVRRRETASSISSSASAAGPNARPEAFRLVFLTAKAMASEIERLMGLGARGVLTKPFDPMSLPQELKTCLGRP